MYDPIIGADIMNITGVGGEKMDIAPISAKLHEIVEYFSGKDYKSEVLRVMVTGGDKFENLWNYVQLKKQKDSKLKEFDLKDFEPDIAEDIINGHLPIVKKQRLKEDLEKRKKLLEQKERQQGEQQVDKKKDDLIEQLSKNKIDLYSKTLEEVNDIDLQLNYYQ